MTITAADVTKAGYYDSAAGKVHTGTLMSLGQNGPFTAYWGRGLPYINLVKGGKILDNPTASPGTADANGYLDASTSGGYQIITHSNWAEAGVYVLRWTGTGHCTWDLGDLSLGRHVTDAQDETNYNDTGDNGTFAGGSDHSVSDVITITGGTTATVDAVSTGAITEFTIDSSGNTGTTDHARGAVLSQTGTTGLGTGFSLTVQTDNLNNRREYTVSQAQANVVIAINNQLISVSQGAPTLIELLLLSEETSLDSGNILTADFKASVSGSDTFRVQQMQGINDGNPHQDFSDIEPYGWHTWTGPLNVGGPLRPMTPQLMAEIAEELSQTLWCHIPHQATDAYVTSFCAELDTHLLTQRAKLELSNEGWNGAAGFNDQKQWFTQGDIAHQDGVITPATASVAATGHGLTTEDSIRCFFSGSGGAKFPYANGGQRWVIVDDVNTFRLADSQANAASDTDVAPLDSTYTDLRFKPETSANTLPENYATRCVEIWDLAEAQLGTKLDKVAAWFIESGAGGIPITEMLAITGFREGLFYSEGSGFAFAPYFDFRGLADWENQTNEVLADYIMNTSTGWAADIEADFQGYINDLGAYKFFCYECGEHNGAGGLSAEQQTKVLEWARSSSLSTVYDWYFPWMASWGVKLATHYISHTIYAGNGTFGAMEHPGDTDAIKYLALKTFFDAGGASKP